MNAKQKQKRLVFQNDVDAIKTIQEILDGPDFWELKRMAEEQNKSFEERNNG